MKKMIHNKQFGQVYNFENGKSNVNNVWKWGANNLFPIELTELARKSPIHRRIINDKADYIAGQGFGCDLKQEELKEFIECCNGAGESLRWVISRVAFDKVIFGNAFIEIVTNENVDFISLFHQDASMCRLAKESKHVVMHHNWRAFKKIEAKVIPIFPNFEKQNDGSYRSMIHYKEYEPTFKNYGIPKYVAAIEAAMIAKKTNLWNLSRLDNAFQPSGVMVLDGQVDTPEQAESIAIEAQKKFSGKPGQVMFMVKNGIQEDVTKFVPINTATDSDWTQLNKQATDDIIIAHSWYRTLSGIDYSTGFSAERIQYEYEIAINSIVKNEQKELLEPLLIMLEDLLGYNCESVTFINKPPFKIKPNYMFVWEARKEDGLKYDPNEDNQNLLLAQIL